LWVALWLLLPETSRSLDARALEPARLARTWREIAAHPTFRAWALLSAGTYAGLFILLAGSSYVFIEWLGLSPAGYGFTLALNSAAYIGGTFLCRHWIARHGITATVARGAVFTLAGGLGMAGAAALGLQSVATVLGPMLLFAIGHGIHQPCGQAGAVGPFPRAAGAASALAGFTLAFIAFLVGQWLGQALDGSLQPFAYGFAATTVATVVVAWSLVQRHGVLRPLAA
jgi:DHA1 family bicyclomycin/chloramphenicol resistance-like MFS transporter